LSRIWILERGTSLPDLYLDRGLNFGVGLQSDPAANGGYYHISGVYGKPQNCTPLNELAILVDGSIHGMNAK
jgi:hypothetical protein